MSWERRRIIPALQPAAVKVAFSDPDARTGTEIGAEQMWLTDINFDGTLIHGTLLSSPNWLKSIKQGDDVRVPLERINDWMYAIHDRAYGAFTVNLLRSRMSSSERRKHDSAWGLDFGAMDRVRLVPPDYLDDKARLPGLWARVFGRVEAPQDPDAVVAREHPMALAMLPSFAEQLKQNPSLVNATDDNGLTFLHQFALAGAAGEVALLLKHGADRTARTHAGLTPLQLAQVFDWQNVITLLT